VIERFKGGGKRGGRRGELTVLRLVREVVLIRDVEVREHLRVRENRVPEELASNTATACPPSLIVASTGTQITTTP
jgi:hypothetical protein